MDIRKKPSSDKKLVARHAIGTFGAPPNVWRFACEGENFCLDIGGCADRPVVGVVSYTTIGLSDYEVMTGPEPPAHVELAAACAADRPLFANILAAAAMLLVRQRKEIKPGDATRDVIAEFYPRANGIASLLCPPLSLGPAARLVAGRVQKYCLAPGRAGHWRRVARLQTQGDTGLEQLYLQRRVEMYSLDRATWLA